MEEKINLMKKRFKHEGFTFTEKQERQFYSFYNKMIEKNKVMNLTSITEFDEVIDKHFLDSISLNRVIDFTQPLEVLDIGTGAGFPGIPLKIAYPDIQLTLMDSVNKKIVYLNEVVEELGLTSVNTIHARAEELARNQLYREKFNLCVSRAVANLSTLLEYCLPFVQIGGKFVSYKSGEVEEEVKESKRACFLLGGKIKEIHKFDLKDNKRSFIVIEKIKTTPKTYPRKAGTPSKLPLK